MSLAGVASSSAFNQLANLQSLFQKGRSDWRQLAQSLRSGDLAGAQQAFNDLVALRQNAPSGGQGSNTRVARDFEALGQALQAGDLAGAQQAFATLRRDALGRQPYLSHHRYARDGGGQASPGPAIVVNLSSGSGSGSNTATAAPSPSTGSNHSSVPATTANSGSTGTSLAPITSTVGSATPVPTATASTTDENSSAGSSVPEIIFNLGKGTQHGTSPNQEIIFNLGNRQGNSGPGITLNVDNTSTGSEVDIRIGNGPEIALNFAGGSQGSGPDIIFNLGNGHSQSQAGGIQINVLA
jgi:hypothetical protein